MFASLLDGFFSYFLFDILFCSTIIIFTIYYKLSIHSLSLFILSFIGRTIAFGIPISKPKNRGMRVQVRTVQTVRTMKKKWSTNEINRYISILPLCKYINMNIYKYIDIHIYIILYMYMIICLIVIIKLSRMWYYYCKIVTALNYCYHDYHYYRLCTDLNNQIQLEFFLESS